VDTVFSMGVGWAINSAMILLAASTFFRVGVSVETLEQAQAMLHPLVGNAAALVFALALLGAGLASTLTAAMAGGSIFAGIFDRPFAIREPTSRWGVAVTILPALLAAILVSDTLRALVFSQVLLSIQLPVTILLLVALTSSRNVMGAWANTTGQKVILGVVAAVVIGLNLALLGSVAVGG
jgi:manganese transport protein